MGQIIPKISQGGVGSMRQGGAGDPWEGGSGQSPPLSCTALGGRPHPHIRLRRLPGEKEGERVSGVGGRPAKTDGGGGPPAILTPSPSRVPCARVRECGRLCCGCVWALGGQKGGLFRRTRGPLARGSPPGALPAWLGDTRGAGLNPGDPPEAASGPHVSIWGGGGKGNRVAQGLWG